MSDTGIRVGAALLVTTLAGFIGLRSSAPDHTTPRRPPTVSVVARPQLLTAAGVPLASTTSTTTASAGGTGAGSGSVLGWERVRPRSGE